MRCDKCAWWRDRVCRKYPPKVIAITTDDPYADKHKVVASTEWPATYEDDYCSKFERK